MNNPRYFGSHIRPCPYYIGRTCPSKTPIDWISVEDDLPKPLERVLVVCTNPGSVADKPHVSIATYRGKSPYSGKPIWTKYKQVTHWMYPPEFKLELVSKEK